MSLSLIMIGNSRSSPRKAYLRPVGKGLSSIGGLGRTANSSKGSPQKGSASSSMKNLASSSNPSLAKKSKDAALNSSSGSSCGYGLVLEFKECEMDNGN